MGGNKGYENWQVIAVSLAAGTLLAGTLCRAADDVRPVTTEKLPNAPGKSVIAIVVHYAPGAKSVKHHHASATKPARLLAIFVADNGAELTVSDE